MSNLILPPNARIDGTLSNITASVVNTRSGMGTARDKSTYNFAGAFLPFTQQERGVIHAGSFEVKRVTEKLPMHMTAKGWTVEIADGKPELVAEFDRYARRLKLQSAFKKAEFYRNLHDGAVIFLLIDDGRKPDEPVDEARIRTIHPITPKYILDRWKVTPSDQTEEPEFYSVIQYSNVLSAKGDRLSYEYADWRGQVHHSRCLRFDDGLADDWIRRLNQGWSPGIFHQFLKPFLDYFSGFQALGAMLQDASLFTYAINGLMQQILDGNEKLIRDRLTENWLATSNYGAIIHDAEHEKVGFTERSLAGWDSSLSRLENRLVAASGLPHSVLLGRAGSGGGLDGNGESEAKLMVETTTTQQENSFRDKLEYLYRLITLAKDGPTQGKEIDHEVKFNPIYTPTQQEQAELESLVIQKDVQAIGAGIYTPEDALRSHYSTNEFNPSITIDWDKKEKEFAQQQEQAAAEEAALAEQEAALAEQEGAIAPEEEEAPEELPPEDEGFNLEEFELEGQTDSADLHLDDRYAHINFYPPTFMRKAAKRGLELRRKFGRGGLSIQEASDQGIGSGVARARDIANGAQLSPDTVKRMHAYFSRHQRDKKKGWDDPKNPTNGFIAWNLWGDSGDGKGWRWVKDRIAQMELADRKAKQRQDTAIVRFDGIEWVFDARKSSGLKVGDTKTVGDKTYVFNENRRWARQQEEAPAEKKSRSRKKTVEAELPPAIEQEVKAAVVEPAKRQGRTRKKKEETPAPEPKQEAPVAKSRRKSTREAPAAEAPAETPPKKRTTKKQEEPPAPSPKKDMFDAPTDADFKGWANSNDPDKQEIADRFARHPHQVHVIRNPDGSMRSAVTMLEGGDTIRIKNLVGGTDKDREEAIAAVVARSVQGGKGGAVDVAVPKDQAKAYRSVGFTKQSELFGIQTLQLSGAKASKLLEKQKGLFDGNVKALTDAIKQHEAGKQEAISKEQAAEIETFAARKPIKKVSESSRTRLDDGLTVSGNKRITDASLDKAFTAFAKQDDETAERIGDLRQFMNSRGIQTVFVDRAKDSSMDSTQSVALAKKLKDKGFVEEIKGRVAPGENPERFAVSLTEEGGFTSGSFRHVVVSSNSKHFRAQGSFGVDPEALKERAQKVLDARSRRTFEWGVANERMAPDDYTFIVTLHEVGHQVHASAGEPKPPGKMKTITDYGRSSHHETFAEAFALYMLDAKAYRQYDQVGHDWVDQIFKDSLK